MCTDFGPHQMRFAGLIPERVQQSLQIQTFTNTDNVAVTEIPIHDSFDEISEVGTAHIAFVAWYYCGRGRYFFHRKVFSQGDVD